SIQRTGPFPLSFAQNRFWFLNQIVPDNPVFNVGLALRFTGPLERAVLEHCINQIVRRHEPLRTTFALREGQPVQVINPELTLSLPVVDLEFLPEADREIAAERLAQEQARQPFNLTEGPLLRIHLVSLSQHDHLLLFVIHHIVFDGWSSGVLLKELVALYRAFTAGKPSSLPELTVQYADFARQQRERLQGSALETQLAYWKRQLSGNIPLLSLPTDRPRPAVQTFRGAIYHFTLPLDQVEAFKRLSHQEGVTLFMTLLAAWQTLLYRYTGQADICVGSPIANRTLAEIEGLIGCFINPLALRTSFEANLSFRELLQRVRQTTLAAYAHQDLPFEMLVEALQPERDWSYNPFFQVMMIFQNMPLPNLTGSDLTVRLSEIEAGTAQLDLTLELVETAAGLDGRLEYNTDLFDPETIAHMAGHFQTLLSSIIAAPEQKVSTLPLLTVSEQRQLLVQWNDTLVAYPQESCIQHLFEAQVEQTPEAIALVFKDQQLTYRELNQRANQLAHYLQKQGVQPEMLVGLCLERSPEMIIGILGILKAGGAYLPLDPNYPTERLAALLHDAQTSLVLTLQQFASRLSTGSLDAFQLICIDIEWAHIAQEANANPTNDLTPQNPVYVIYTSGSTGTPKGVLIEHRSLVNFSLAAGRIYNLKPGDRALQFAALTWDTSAEEIFPCLTHGATLVLRTEAMLDSMAAFLQECQTWFITVLSLPTAFWHELTAQLAAAALTLPSSIRLVIFWRRASATGLR
ncbi:MAG: AMP-binding protein, partial [Anaerolineales bacterium]|nr:AMP-binding protein [Anaerolineales bacterium]